MSKKQRAPRKTFAELLEHLFQTVPNPKTGRLWSNRAAAEELTRRGFPISHTQVGKLRRGTAPDPRLEEMRAIAELFGKPLSYFTGEHDEDKQAKLLREALADQQLREALTNQLLREALADPDIRKVALRMADMSKEGIAAVRAMVEQVKRLEAAARRRGKETRNAGGPKASST